MLWTLIRNNLRGNLRDNLRDNFGDNFRENLGIIKGQFQDNLYIPGGRLEHPVVNCKNAFLSASVKSTNTLTNLRKAGDSRV